MNCFIIMPISTPDFLVERYKGDRDHFRHVLDHLFLPALKAAGIDAIPPIAKGADIIHAGIIKHLETAELVLCDMSSLNANVFFELGIRTAVNKPIALVKDDVTPHVPFDATIINNHTYLSALDAWAVAAEVEKLKVHLSDCVKGAKPGNSLWSYFSMSARAEPLKEGGGQASQLEFLSAQVVALREEMRASNGLRREESSAYELSPKTIGQLIDVILRRLSREGVPAEVGIDEKGLFVEAVGPVSPKLAMSVESLVAAMGMRVHWGKPTGDITLRTS